MGKVKVVVVGNCQSRPLAMLLERMNENVVIEGVAVVHLLQNDDVFKYMRSFEEADYIVTQLIADNYRCDFVRTSNLKKQYGDKVVTVLNLFFKGYDQGWGYKRIPNSGTMLGPMGDYHSEIIFESWVNGCGIDEAASLLLNRKYNSGRYGSVSKISLLELKDREKNIDVGITDYIEREYLNSRLFFTFNHPSLQLLIEYVKRILTYLDSSFKEIKSEFLDEPLHKFIPIPTPVEIDGAGGKYKGIEVIIDEQWGLKTGGEKLYSATELVCEFYRTYNFYDVPPRKLDSDYIPKTIIQYWSDEVIPYSISVVMNTWKERNPDFTYKVYHKKNAEEYISLNFGEVIGNVFSKIKLPAMQSDFFRVAYCLISGGVYIDALIKCNQSISKILNDERKLILMKRWNGRVSNAFIAAPSDNAELRFVFSRMLSNISLKDNNNVWAVTGAGLFNEKDIDAKYLDQLDVPDYFELTGNTGKKSNRHWTVVQENESIYL